MKNTINKIILFAAVLFAAGVSQNAAAVGYYIEIPSRTAVYTAVDYDNEADAISAAEQLCRAGEGASAGNRCFATATRAAFTNMLIVHTTEGFGVGENFNAAYTDLIDRCEDPGAALDRMTCEDIFPSNNLIVCGDGTAADFADDNCGERNPDVSICGTGTTGNGGRVNSDCVCTDSTHNLITDTTTNTQTCEPIPPTCDTTTTELNTGTNMCDCRTGFSGRVSPTMCERNAADCTGATPVLFNGICVAACQPDEARNSAGVCEPNPANCGANAITNPDDDTNCICIDDMHRFVAGSTTECEPIPAMCGANAINNPNDNTMCVCENTETHQFVAGSTTDCEPIPTNPNTPTCEEHEMLNSSDECVNRTAENCGNGEVFSPVNTGGICQTPAAFFAANTITVAARYSAESCERAGWISSIAINNEKTAAAEVCGIPVVRDDSVTITAAAAESVPLQFPENENANGCIIRESADFLTLPDCNDSQLFGDGGFPQMPENFNIATDRLIVAVVADGRNRVFFNGNEIRTAVASLQNNETEVAIFGAVGIAMAAFAIVDFFHNGRPADAFAFSPEFNYSISESDYFVRAGGKIEYAVNENLRMQWSAGQTNTGGDFGDFRYLSKAEYKTDLFAATFSESVAGKTANYNFSLSADVDGRLVDFSPVYRLHSEWKESDSGIKTETQNELNLESVLRYNRWTIRPSAGFRWENANDFANNGKLQMNAVYRF